jgi:acyl carrier protein
MNTKEQILAILKEVKPTKNLENVTDIIEGGYIDSFELMALISHLNENFGIEVSFEDLVPENFNSVDAMGQMVERLMK